MASKLERALASTGWMRHIELVWLEQISQGKQLVIEMGSWCGRSSLVLSHAAKLVCVDTWTGSSNQAEGAPEHITALDPYAQFQANLAPELAEQRVEIARGNLVSPAFCDALVAKYAQQADLVFVDACHTEDEVALNIQLADKLVKPGGVVCGHDYTTWPGVRRAVQRCAQGRALLVPAFSIWQYA